jgi:hypothetical protein
MAEKTLDDFAQDYLDGVLDGIDKRLKLIDKRLKPFDKLIQTKQKLEGARRAILAERSTTAGGGRGLTQAEVVKFMTDKGPLSVFEIAQGLSTNEAVVRGHLNRGKDERFSKNGDNKWELRDPESDDEGDEEDE